jgi:peptide/nickel transport system permease protein
VHEAAELAGASRHGLRISSLTRNPWARFLARRLAGLCLVVAAVVVAAFLMIHLIPGDPVTNTFGVEVPGNEIPRLRHLYGFDRPLYTQFGKYVARLAHGDLGYSFRSNEAVGTLVRERAVPSLELAGAAFGLVLLGGVGIGMLAGALTREGRRKPLGFGFSVVTSLVASIPDYLLGTVLAFLFAVQFRLLPVAGTTGLRSLVLPAVAVGVGPMMALARIVRAETLNVLAKDYVRTARSQQLPARVIYTRHVLPNILTAALTVGGLILAGVISGAVIVENVFARVGLGSSVVQAVLQKDFAVVQGITLVLGVVVVTVNAIVDVIIALLDPRAVTGAS